MSNQCQMIVMLRKFLVGEEWAGPPLDLRFYLNFDAVLQSQAMASDERWHWTLVYQ
jgi:hypothetical protein